MTCLLVLLVLTTVLGWSGAADAAPSSDWSVIGHRGFPRGGHTEDTIPSFAAAVSAGATSVELDLHLTSDLGMVVMHDPTLDRTTTCTGEVADYTVAELTASCHGNVAGEPIPTAEDVLTWAAAHQVNVILEIKYDAAGRWTADRFAALDGLIKAHDMVDRVVIMSFYPDYLATAEQVDPALETDWIADGWPGVAVIASHGDVVNLHASRLTAARVAQLHAAGVRVFGRDTDSVAAWRRLAKVGADGLLTDVTPTYVAWRAGQQQRPSLRTRHHRQHRHHGHHRHRR